MPPRYAFRAAHPEAQRRIAPVLAAAEAAADEGLFDPTTPPPRSGEVTIATSERKRKRTRVKRWFRTGWSTVKYVFSFD